MTKLTSDELGELGQDKFKELCSAEGLHANPSQRDRTGWDFRVEQPNSVLDQNAPFDLRPLPEPVMVQVKTILSTSQSFSLKLRTFERLAKLQEPVFVVIPVFDQHTKEFAFGAMHVVDDALEKTLRRLAEVHAKDGKLKDNGEVSFSRKKWWHPIKLAGDQPLTQYFGDQIKIYRGSENYAAKKDKQLRELGYSDGNTHTINFSVTAGDEGEIYEGFLGLRTLNITNFQHIDNRFGLKRLQDDPAFSSGELKVSPAKFQNGYLRLEQVASGVHRDAGVTWAIAPLPAKKFSETATLIYLHQLRILILPQGKTRLWLEPLENIKLSSAAWLEMFSCFREIVAKEATFALLTEDYETIFRTGLVEFSDFSEETLRMTRGIERLAEMVDSFMRRAGLPTLPIEFDDVLDEERVIGKVETLAREQEAEFTLDMALDEKSDGEKLLGNSAPMLFGGSMHVEGRIVVYACQATAIAERREDGFKLNCRRNGEMRFQVVGDKKTFEAFFDKLSKKWRPTMMIVPDSPNF